MEIFAIVGVTVFGAALIQVLRRGAPEIGLTLAVGAGVVVLLWSMEQGQPLFERIGGYYANTAGLEQGQVEILFKALGICFLVQIGADACRDFGESAMASKIELAGKITVLVLALPLFDQLLGIVGTLMG